MRARSPLASRLHSRRSRLLSAGLAVMAAVYLARATQLQVVQRDKWQAAVDVQTGVRQLLPATRGRILDREGRPLALSRQEYQAYYAPAEVKDHSHAVATITRVLGLSRRERARLQQSSRGWVAIPGHVTARTRDELVAAVGPCVYFEAVPSRVYPEGGRARAILGTPGVDGSGGTGLEAVLDSFLVGKAGEVYSRRDGRGGTVRDPDTPVSLPTPGHDVFLTLDAELQAVAEEALDQALRKTGASGGDVVMADPRTGELLAVASRRQGSTLRIPALSDPFEPGSTVKPFLLAALLQEGRASLDDKVYAERGRWVSGSRSITDVHEYDTLTVAEVVQVSSNIGAAKLSARLEPGEQYRYLRDFGFGTPTGIELQAESAGLLRRPEEWSSLSQASLAIGYELMVTSIQLVAAYGALANGGILLKPQLVREVRDSRGRTVYRASPEPIRRVVSADVARSVAEVLGSVVEVGGTGAMASMSTVSMAGKTGTARIAASSGGYGERRYISSFVGFAPREDPRLVILVKLEDPQGAYYGGTIAAPVSRAILETALASSHPYVAEARQTPAQVGRLEWGLAGVESPGRAVLVSMGEAHSPLPAAGLGESPLLPDLRGWKLRAAAARLHELGFYVELEASGRVRKQIPAGGSRVVPGATVLLQ